jgi:hypothetical protein
MPEPTTAPAAATATAPAPETTTAAAAVPPPAAAGEARREQLPSEQPDAAATAAPATDRPEGEEATEVAPATESQTDAQPELEAARRYARLVATDIRLYNEEAVVLGRRNGDLDRRLEEHLDRGKETFLRRHADLGAAGLDLLHEAYVQVLAAGDPELIPPSVVR